MSKKSSTDRPGTLVRFLLVLLLLVVFIQMRFNLLSTVVTGFVFSWIITASTTDSLQIIDDGNRILYRGLDPAIFQRLGQYSPRYTVQSNHTIPVPSDCHIEVVNSLERHGARLMTASAQKKAQATLYKIQSALQKSQHVEEGMQFLINATLIDGTDSLVPYGALQAYFSGKSTASQYSQLSKKEPFIRASGDTESLDDRVILTAKYWRLGFIGEPFPSDEMTTADDVRRLARLFKDPDVTISEMKGRNNTLDVSTCPANENRKDIDGEDGAQEAYSKSTLIPHIGKRLQQRFQSSGVPDLELSGTDLINLANMCSFETLSRASVSHGRLSIKQSPFCNLFNKTEWEILGYVYDVGKWKGAGYGNPYHKALGQGFLRELLSRLTNRRPILSPPTSLNSTLDGASGSFPLPNKSHGPVVFFDGSHDNSKSSECVNRQHSHDETQDIAPIISAALLFNGPKLRVDRDAYKEPHKWVFSQIAPLQGKIVFEKVNCPRRNAEQEFVRIRANGALLDISKWCPTELSTYGLCPLEKFAKQLDFTNTDQEWNTCFT